MFKEPKFQKKSTFHPQDNRMNRDIFALCEFEKATEARQIPAYWQLWDILNWTSQNSKSSSSSDTSSLYSGSSVDRRRRSPSDASSEKSSLFSSSIASFSQSH
jgi:hypothetical protein